MKKAILIIAIILAAQFSAQIRMDYDWKNMNDSQRKDLISKMSPQERMQLLKQFKENMLVSEIDVPQANQEEFRNLFAEYQESQKAIREKFRADFQPENLSDEEAKKRLEESFNVAQQLLDNRKRYSEKFQKFLTPQQVLKLFQSEGKMREKVLDRREDGNFKGGFGRPR